MKSRFYLYAVFFAVIGVVFFVFFINDKGPVSLSQLTQAEYPVILETREELRGSRSQSLTLKITGNKHYTLEDWAPNYEQLIKSIKDGTDVVSLWSDRSGTIYQIELGDGSKMMFIDAVNADSDNNTMVAFIWLLIGGAGVFWSVRKAKQAS